MSAGGSSEYFKNGSSAGDRLLRSLGVEEALLVVELPSERCSKSSWFTGRVSMRIWSDMVVKKVWRNAVCHPGAAHYLANG